MKMDLKMIFADVLHEQVLPHWTKEELYTLIETPKFSHMGDAAFPCFGLAKEQKKAPQAIATEFAGKVHSPYFASVEAAGPYVNVKFDPVKTGKQIVSTILDEQQQYGTQTFGNNRTVVLDLSSPNIAKPFSMGHLRSTVIGNAIAGIGEKCGFDTVKINYVGDWGTQFGKLMVAYKKWGDEGKVKQNPIAELFTLYKRFHEEAETDPSLDEEGRKAFKLLEDGDAEMVSLWKWFKDESLSAFKEIYTLLGVEFDSYNGEAYFNDKMDEVVELLAEKGLLTESDGAQVVWMTGDTSLPPCLIKKSDGATLYATRDLAAALYRQREYGFDEALYIVGQEQTVHFKQVKNVLAQMGYDWADHMKHIPFGLYLKGGKKMSTRKGRVILLEEVLREAIALSQQNIESKNPHLPDAEAVAQAVGVGAVIFHDLKNDRLNDIEFSLDHMLTFEGETGPYIQYTNARAHSILRKSHVEAGSFTGLADVESWEVIKQLRLFPEVIARSWTHYSPSILAKYLIETAQHFNRYYGKTKILSGDGDQASRVSLVAAVSIVLTEGLRILGISAPMEM
jgi:arginyl-tRNA synthetase